MSRLAGAGAVAGVEVRRLTRDRLSFLFVLVLPVAVIVIVGSTFAANEGALPIGLVAVDDGDVVTAFESAETLDVERYDDVDDLTVAVRTGAVAGGVVVDGDSVTLVSDVARSDAAAVRTAVTGVVADEGAIVAVADAYDLRADAVRAVANSLERVTVERRSVDGDDGEATSPFSYAAPSNLVLFTFLNSLAIGASIVASKQLGVLQRWRSAPVRRSSLLAGVVASRLVFALVQAGLLLVIGAVVFGVDWGSPPAVIALVGVFCLVATGFGVLAGVVARTPEQTSAVGVPLSIGLGMLGGCMWPLEIVGEPMRIAGHATPHAWAMDGFIALIFDGDGIAAIGLELAVLAAMATVVLALAVRLAGRRLV